MKKLLSVLFIINIFTGCNLFTPQDSSVTVILDRGRSITPQDFTSFSLTVSGSGMSTITEETSTNVIEVTVPVGSNRQFKIAGTLKNGIIISGSKTRDVSGGSITITINLSEYDVSGIPTDNIQYGSFGLEDSLYTLLGERSGFNVGEDITLKASPKEGAIYYQWLSGDIDKVVETDKTEGFNIPKFIQEPGPHTLTFRVYYMDRVEEETVYFEIVDSSIIPQVIDFNNRRSMASKIAGSVGDMVDIDVSMDERYIYALYNQFDGANRPVFEVFDTTKASGSESVASLDIGTTASDKAVKIASYTSNYGAGNTEKRYIFAAFNSSTSRSVAYCWDVTTPEVQSSIIMVTVLGFIEVVGGISHPKDLNIYNGKLYLSTDTETMEWSITDNSDGSISLTTGATYNSRGAYSFKMINQGGAPESFFTLNTSIYKIDNGPVESTLDTTLGMYPVDMVYDSRYIYAVGVDNFNGTRNANKGLTIIDTLAPKDNTVINTHPLEFNATTNLNTSHRGVALAPDSNWLLVADNKGGLKVFNVMNKSSVFLSETYGISGGTNDIVVGSNNVYLSDIKGNQVHRIAHNF